MAGVSGFEPELSVLETDVLTVNTIPLQTQLSFRLRLLFGFAVWRVLAALAAKLLEFQSLSGLLLILRFEVISIFALSAL